MEPIYAAVYARLQILHGEFDKALTGATAALLDWSPGPEMNSIGVLSVHVAGSERYWIGELVGGEAAHRVREEEFLSQEHDAAALQARLAAALAQAEQILRRLTDADLGRNCPPHKGEVYTVAWSLMHALEHVAQHVGHVQLTRQLWEQQAKA